LDMTEQEWDDIQNLNTRRGEPPGPPRRLHTVGSAPSRGFG
jgi:hypothetical protein